MGQLLVVTGTVALAPPPLRCLQNCVVYAGGKRDREVIEEHDLYFAGKGGRRNRLVKPNVVLASYETVLKEDRVFKVRGPGCLGSPFGLHQCVPWRASSPHALHAQGRAAPRARC